MNLPSRYWHPDENAEDARELSDADKVWALDKFDPTWRQRTYSINAAWAEFGRIDPNLKDKLIAEIDDDNRELEWLDCGETLADVVADVATPALMRRQAN